MSTTTTNETTETTTDPKAPTPAQAPAAAPPAATPAPTSQAAPSEAQAARTEAGVTKMLSGDDDEIPEDDASFTLSRAALMKRLKRHSAKELKQLFGTDDVDQIKKDYEDLQKLRAREEEERQAKLTADEKHREEVEKLRKEKEQAIARTEYIEFRAAAKQGKAEVHGLLSQYVNKDFAEAAEAKIVAHIRKNPELFGSLSAGRAEIKRFLKKWVDDNPVRAKDYKPELPKIPVTSTPDAEAAKPTPSGQKHASEMTDAEYRAAMRARGITNFLARR